MKYKDLLGKRLENLPVSIHTYVARIEGLKGRWISGANLHPQVLKNLKKSVLITSTGASTRIEGSKMTDQDIENMLKGISIQKFSDRDKQEVRGYFELLENVFNSWEDISLNESTIKHFHKELLKYSEKDKLHKGDYKKSENKVHMVDAKGNSVAILFDTTDAYLTPSAMQDLVEWTKNALKDKKYNPLLVIGNFLVQFLKIHPFQDGNGRMSRVLTNFLLLKTGYLYMPYVSHEKIVEDNKPEYYLALRRTQKTFDVKKDDISAWLEFFLKAILKQSEGAIALLSEESFEKTLSQTQLQVWIYLQDNQEVSPRDIAKTTSISKFTIRQVVDKLLKAKKIERTGMGRSVKYRVIDRTALIQDKVLKAK